MPGQATDERSRPPEPLFHFLRNRCSTSSGFRVPLPPEYPRAVYDWGRPLFVGLESPRGERHAVEQLRGGRQFGEANACWGRPQTQKALFRFRNSAFFVSERGARLHYHVLARTFVQLARRLGLRGPVGARGVSLHKLRHSFAVGRLAACTQQGIVVRDRLPALAVYLGYVSPQKRPGTHPPAPVAPRRRAALTGSTRSP